jgi:hypothetical protein
MAKIDKILGSISPMYGAVSGQGLFGNALAGLGTALGPTAGLMPLLAREQRKKLRSGRAEDAAKEAEEEAAIAARGGMKHGGMVKKMAKGGAVKKMANGGMPSMKESMESGNRVSRQVGEETKRMMPPKKRTMPSPGESVKSGNRMSGEDAKDLKAVKKYAKGGVTRADGCAVRGKTKGKMV